jgi:hypothetical protein
MKILMLFHDFDVIGLWHQFVNLLPDRHAKFVIIQWISKSPHAFAMCSIRTDLLKQENEKIDSLQIYLDFNLLLIIVTAVSHDLTCHY